jgi:hypothetical protein
MPGNLKFAHQHAITLAGQYDKYSLKVEQENLERPNVTKSMKILYPITGSNTDFKVMVGDLLFQRLQYAAAGKPRKDLGSNQQPHLLSSLNGLMIQKFLFERIPRMKEEEKIKRAVKELIRFYGIAATPYTPDGTTAVQNGGIAVQVGGVVPGFNNSTETFEPGDFIMWDVPLPGEKMQHQKLSEGSRPNQYRLKTIPRKNVSGIRPELLIQWAESQAVDINKPEEEYVRELMQKTRDEPMMSTAGKYMYELKRAEEKSGGEATCQCFTNRAKQLRRVLTLKRASTTDPGPYQRMLFSMSHEFAAVKEADIVLNGQVFAKAFNGAGPGDKLGFNLFM